MPCCGKGVRTILGGLTPMCFLLILATVLASVSFLSAPSVADAEEPTALRNVTLSIFPEYDDALQLGYPSVLVMLDGELEGMELPATVRFLVPESAVMYSAGSGPRESYKRGGSLTRESSSISGWDQVSYEIETNIFVIEYYDAIVDRDSISVEFVPLYPTDGLSTHVKEPLESSGFSVVPESSETGDDADGRKTYHYEYDTLGANENLLFNISYAESPSTNWLLVIGLSIGGVVILAAAFYWVFGESFRQRGTGKQPKTKPVRKLQNRHKERPEQDQFCTQCGDRIEGSGRFCSNCGARVQK